MIAQSNVFVGADGVAESSVIETALRHGRDKAAKVRLHVHHSRETFSPKALK